MSDREHLQHIYDTHGRLDAPTVVEAATPPDHPLHPRFEWDDTRAAHLHRLSQAATLIRRVTITVEETPTPVRVSAFLNVSPDPASRGQYRPATEVATNDDLYRIAEKNYSDQLRALRAKYGHLKRFREITLETLCLAGQDA